MHVFMDIYTEYPGADEVNNDDAPVKIGELGFKHD